MNIMRNINCIALILTTQIGNHNCLYMSPERILWLDGSFNCKMPYMAETWSKTKIHVYNKLRIITLTSTEIRNFKILYFSK